MILKDKCVIILSEKSSGSSALHRLLSQFADIRPVTKTRHHQNETLYWTKAASVLRKPQIDMVDSEVPVGSARARSDLISLLMDNLHDYALPDADKELIMQGWRLLCNQYSPIFLEKSPHHLCQWSALELIMEFAHGATDVDLLLVGLIRNPMDTIYSQYRRWKSPPTRVERQWLTAYRNLLRLSDLIGNQVAIVRYEDMVSSLDAMETVFRFCGVSASDANEQFFHQRSLQKWKSDPWFGFSLAEETITLAEQYGYAREQLVNGSRIWWPMVRPLSRMTYRLTAPMKRFARRYMSKTMDDLAS